MATSPSIFESLSADALRDFCRLQSIGRDTIPSEKSDLVLLAQQTAKGGLDLTPVRNAIASALLDRSHDDGSYAPLLIRFAWHNSGTYDAASRTGGSNGSTMRFPAERGDPENAGLDKAIALLEPVCKKFPWLSQADIWILAGYVAIEESGGPSIPFSHGRVDYTAEQARAAHANTSGCPFGDGKFNPSTSRLPPADLGPDPNAPPGCPMHIKEKPTIDAVRSTFSRMGFSDKEAVCLIILGHQYGRCHPDVSGYEHPWYAFGPAEWNVYRSGLGYLSIYNFAVARNQLREVKTSKGKRQWNSIRLSPWGEPLAMLLDRALVVPPVPAARAVLRRSPRRVPQRCCAGV